MTLEEFIAVYNGKFEMFDNESYRGQCTQIVKRWCQEQGNPVPNSGGTNKANDYKKFNNGHEFIPNTPTGMPNKGDIVIWKTTVGSGYGHVAIYCSGNLKNFLSFEQNWPQLSPCHVQYHDYNQVEGWLTPLIKTTTENPPQATISNETPQPLPKYPFTRNLYPGLRNDGDVIQLQTYLKQKGVYPPQVPITGNYLEITKKAVAELQVQNKIVDTINSYGAGYCGPKTRNYINNN